MMAMTIMMAMAMAIMMAMAMTMAGEGAGGAAGRSKKGAHGEFCQTWDVACRTEEGEVLNNSISMCLSILH